MRGVIGDRGNVVKIMFFLFGKFVDLHLIISKFIIPNDMKFQAEYHIW